MKRRWLWGLAAVVVLPGAWWLNAHVQEQLIYAPVRYPAGCAREPWGIEYEISAGRQTAFYVPPAQGGPPARLWLMFGGNGCLALTSWRAVVDGNDDPAAAFLLLDYPGFGFCEGRPSPAAIQESADRALARLREQWGGGAAPRLRVLGYSLGTGPALHFAARHEEAGAIILLAPFTSIGEMQKFFYGVRTDFLLRHRFDNRSRVAALARRAVPPKLVIVHGGNDVTVPPAMGRQLAALLPSTAVFLDLPGAGHDGVCDVPLILECMREGNPARPRLP